MDEKKMAKYLLISLVSILAIAWVLTLTSMNTKGNSEFRITKDAACFNA